jgi:uncharacterized membrane protein YdbT with pleckstrin-like domain
MLARIPPVPAHERVIWEGRSAWADQAILFIFIGAAGLRLLVAVRYGQWLTAVLYTFAMVFFVAIGAAFRYAVYYQIGAQRIRVISGLWHLHIDEIPLSRVRSVTVKRELLNRWLNVGALEIEIDDSERHPVLLKGVPEPERIKRQIVPLLPSSPQDQRESQRA